MSSENTECFFEIDTRDGWEKSLTKILSSFEDPVFDINPTLGYAYVKGKTDRQKILKKLKKGGKHSDLKRITFGGSQGVGNNNNHQNHPYASLSKMGSLYDPYCYANDPYNYHSYGNYNPWHNNNNLNPLFLNNNARNYYHGANHHLPRPLHSGHYGSFHRHDSSVPSSSSSSSTTSSSSSHPVTQPEPLRSAPPRRFGFIKKVFSIKKVLSIKKVTRKFRSYLRFCDKN